MEAWGIPRFHLLIFESFEVSGIANNFLEYHQGIEFDGIHTARAFVNYVW